MHTAALSSRAVAHITGADWQPFLHRILTCHTLGLRPSEIRFGALLTPQGKFLADVFLHATDDGAWIETDASRMAMLLQRLTLYKLRSDAVLTPRPDLHVFARWGENGNDPRLPALGDRWIVPLSEGEGGAQAKAWEGEGLGPIPSDEAAYRAHQIALGVPDLHADVSEKLFPIEANFDQLNGIDFKKGCFVGQEVTSRMHRRGIAKTRLVPLKIDGPVTAGDVVLNADLQAGTITSSTGDRAMALLRLDRCDGVLTVHDRLVHLAAPDWLDWGDET